MCDGSRLLHLCVYSMGASSKRRQPGHRNAHGLQLPVLHAALVILLNDDNRSRSSTGILGFPSRRQRKQKKEILPHVQRIQARKMSPLLGLQQMRPKYGPPLSMD